MNGGASGRGDAETRRRPEEEAATPRPTGLIDREETEGILAAAIEVHRALGPGLLEAIYEEALVYELSVRGYESLRQVAVPVRYKDRRLEAVYFNVPTLRDGIVRLALSGPSTQPTAGPLDAETPGR